MLVTLNRNARALARGKYSRALAPAHRLAGTSCRAATKKATANRPVRVGGERSE